MTFREFARLPVGTVIHSGHEGRRCDEAVIDGPATLASLRAGEGGQPVAVHLLPWLHLPDDCLNPHWMSGGKRWVA